MGAALGVGSAEGGFFLFVDLSAVSDVDNGNQQNIMVKFIDNTVVADAQAKDPLVTGQRLDVTLRQLVNSAQQTLLLVARLSFDEFLSAFLYLYAVAHAI